RHTRSKRDWSSDVCSSDLEHLSLALLQPVFLLYLFLPPLVASFFLAGFFCVFPFDCLCLLFFYLVVKPFIFSFFYFFYDLFLLFFVFCLNLLIYFFFYLLY